jgi:hypothetical protein
MGRNVRRLGQGLFRPDDQPLSEPMWLTLTGQKVLPLAGKAAIKLVEHYWLLLEEILQSDHRARN